jgi:hypothetical protein
MPVENHLNYWQILSQDIRKSWTNQLEETTDQKISNVKNSLEQSWQNVTDMKNATSGVVGSAISTYFNEMITQHPTILKILQILNWAIIHPVMGVILLLIIIAFLWSIIKGIVRLIETASWSIFKIPLKLLQFIFVASFGKLIKLKNTTLVKNTDEQKKYYFNADVNLISCQEKNQRLIEINNRLELIHKEQQELLQEAAELIRNNASSTLRERNS